VHELGIAAEVYRSCRQVADSRGGGRIESVTVAVGELTGVEPELLAYAWEAVVEAGVDRGARLEVEWRPARQDCPSCGEVAERGRGSWLRLCPHCGLALRVEGGEELDLLSLTFTPDEEKEGSAP
jgi:hydrogenase nickel incorporation protein HypA/HybF